ncbi:hypothetical protein [Janthinobacterium sp. AD80]|jgi:hypothetical protein|uniref:hypothetical protein n=1 Tax=Janthinobacterium sp. AD80 TaxID=1528773 RepID=UPI000C84DEA2|nr:hypothetical protein [Janthinobacterium sp. AD80]PMQ12629.1 hypothetical protein JaAD80_22550 [Janthinobacterium sp. AD80]
MKKIGLLSLAVLLGACDIHFGSFANDWKTADAATDVFHQYAAQGKFSAMYGMGSALMKQQQTEQEFVQAAEQGMQIYGPMKVARQLRAACFPNQVRLLYQTDFQNGKATEKLVWQVRGNKAELISYQVEPGEVDLDSLPDSSCSK